MNPMENRLENEWVTCTTYDNQTRYEYLDNCAYEPIVGSFKNWKFLYLIIHPQVNIYLIKFIR